MSSTQSGSDDAVSKALSMLKRLRRLQGTALINSGILVHSDIPTAAGKSGEEFSRECVELFEQLEENASPADRVLLGFDGGNLLLVNRFPVILALFFDEIEAVESAERGGNQFLTQFETGLGIRNAQPVRSTAKKSAPSRRNADSSPPEKEAESSPSPTADMSDPAAEWKKFSIQIETILTKVLGSAQATRMIQRELKAMGVGEDDFLKRGQFRPFGMKLIQRIRDKNIRRQLEDELIDLLKTDDENDSEI